MPLRIAAELQALASEARRKHPDVRHAADAAATALREPNALEKLRAETRPPAEHTLLAPLLLAFATRTPRIVLPAQTALHRCIVVQALPDDTIQTVLDALHDLVATQRIDVDAQLKVLQIASALLTAYASVTAERLSSTLMLCFNLYAHARVAVVSSTAAATLRQNIMTVFDKVADEDALLSSLAEGGEDAAAAAPLPALKAKTPDGEVDLFPCAADAYQLLNDLRALANGEAAQFLPLATLSRTFVLELLESVLTSHAPLFAGNPEPHPELLYVLRSSICPLLLKSLSDPPAFPSYVRTMRLVLLLLQQFSTELVLEIEILLRMLLQMIRRDAQDGRPHWHRILALEVVNTLCADGRFTRRVWNWYDAQQGTPEAPAPVFKHLLEALYDVSVEVAPALDRDTELVSALEQAEPVATANAPSFSTLYGAAAGVASAAVASVRTATEGLLSVRAEPLAASSAPGVALIDQLDKPDAPILGSAALPHTYLAHLAVWSHVLLAQSLAHLVLRRFVGAGTPRTLTDEAMADTDGKAALGMLPRCVETTGGDLAFFLTVRCSDYLYDQVLIALANLASAAGAAGLHKERDRLITTLTHVALPKGTGNNAPRALAPRSLACAAALAGVAMLLADTLDSGWAAVLECLCLVSSQVGARVQETSAEKLTAFFPPPGTASDEVRGAVPHLLTPTVLAAAALQKRIAAVFARGASLEDEHAFDAFCAALTHLASGNVAAERALEELDDVLETGTERLAAQRPEGTWRTVVESLFAIAGNDDVSADRRIYAGKLLDRLLYAALRHGGSDAQQRSIFEALSRQASLEQSASNTALALRKSALELMLRILETHAQKITAWDVVFDMCSDATAAPAPIVKAAFSCIQLICTDHLGQLDDSKLRMCMACIPKFSMQAADMNIALAANGMLWEITTEIQRRDDASRADLWLYVLGELRAVAHAPHADVRNGAIANLFQLLLQFSASLGHKDWPRVIDQVLFPLLTSLEDHSTIEWRASRVLAFQGIGRILSELLVPVFLQDATAMESLKKAFFSHVGHAAKTAPPDVAQAALDALLATLPEDGYRGPNAGAWYAAAAAECTQVAESLHSASTLAQALVLAQVISRNACREPDILRGAGAPRIVDAATKCMAHGLQRADTGASNQLNKLMGTVYSVLDAIDQVGGSHALVVRSCTDICAAAFVALDGATSRPVTTLRAQLAGGALERLDAHLNMWLHPPTLYDVDVVLGVFDLLEKRIVQDEGPLWERQVRVLCTCAQLGSVVQQCKDLFFARIVTLVEQATANAGSDDAHDAHILLILATLETYVLPSADTGVMLERCIHWLVDRTKLYDFFGVKSEKDMAEVRQSSAGTRLATVPVSRERVPYLAWDTCVALATRRDSKLAALVTQHMVPRMADILTCYAADHRVSGGFPMSRLRIEEVLCVIRALMRFAEQGTKLPELIAPLYQVATLPTPPGMLPQKATCGTSIVPLDRAALPSGIPDEICERPAKESFLTGNVPSFLRRDVVSVFLDWMTEYGGAVRFYGILGEPRLMISDPAALEHVLHTRVYSYSKARLAAHTLSSIMGHGLIVSEGDIHRRQKRAIQPGFSAQSIKNVSPVFLRCAELLAEHISSRISIDGHSSLVDMHALTSSATLDALGEAALGLEFGALANASAKQNGELHNMHPLPRALNHSLSIATRSSMWLNILGSATMLFPVLENLPVGVNSKEFLHATGVLHGIASDVVSRAKADVLHTADGAYHAADKGIRKDDERPDLLAVLLRANKNASNTAQKTSVLDRATLSDQEMVGQVSTFIFAGHETTSTQITWLLLQLARNPQAQGRLRNAIHAAREQRGLAREDRPLTCDELAEIPYLDWCLRESLRLDGAIHTTSRIASENDVIPLSDGRRIAVAKGTLVLVPLNSISRDPKLWGDDAHKFVPERWENPPLGARVFPRVGGVSFLQGPRACMGSNFALAEMRAFIGTLISQFSFECDGRAIVPKRWLVSRPYEPARKRDGCVLRVAYA
ncbi:Endocytosis and vacuole integrity protein [Malassezia cuniculi]|uniref:Endocytosis and vacuole integrity protein n=1 Tax=Malassezia cuniculi TaxID=948313 RepID=A0AAF0EW13_9BASI|nr:Endocytosis and vacuole integrity protein [Malassezia cuniculi]